MVNEWLTVASQKSTVNICYWHVFSKALTTIKITGNGDKISAYYFDIYNSAHNDLQTYNINNQNKTDSTVNDRQWRLI